MEKFDLPTFCRLTRQHSITHAYVAPPIVLHLAKSNSIEKRDLDSLRMLTSGGAPLGEALIHETYDRWRIPIRQAYGLSETTSVSHIQVSSRQQSSKLTTGSHGTTGTTELDLMAPCFQASRPKSCSMKRPGKTLGLDKRGSSGSADRLCLTGTWTISRQRTRVLRRTDGSERATLATRTRKAICTLRTAQRT